MQGLAYKRAVYPSPITTILLLAFISTAAGIFSLRISQRRTFLGYGLYGHFHTRSHFFATLVSRFKCRAIRYHDYVMYSCSVFSIPFLPTVGLHFYLMY